MNYLFWQNILSPHQTDFLHTLSQNHSVMLVVESIQDEYRKNDGWEIPEIGSVKLIVNPDNEIIDSLFANKTDIHIFSGMSAYPLVYKAFKKAVRNNYRIGLLSEPINLDGIKGKLKLLRGILQRIKYNKSIDFIAATGNMGVNTYKWFGYPQNKIHQWGYFVELKVTDTRQLKRDNRLIFVGNLNHNKQIFPLVKLFVENNGFKFDYFDILGSGPLGDEIENYLMSTKFNDRVKLHGRLSSYKTHDLISKSSLLILPSLSDGWGVVVNEALLNGTPVIASSKVGANILLKDGRGDIFEVGNMNQLKELLVKWSNKEITQQVYDNIKSWSENSISTKSAAKYFTEIINFTYNEAGKKPGAPWI